ncbi:ribosomal RNA-processing protein 7-domain-containing protein [Kockovaella imperatae]|uniref:Ribosomal RNA-processing protein 7-domain-containing protein n=1 Tax=Kockovaella imperatae TaxID=4999 RepID=A0A1Y1UJV0_9TREE|nr:ribosomal RNA-processing protein 7-domain-containing protein [Kockovaella imperatae]ORX38331.1 ribosomal RNA-processing protein 7-domain-containing protein [Kockovaella imperatae]
MPKAVVPVNKGKGKSTVQHSKLYTNFLPIELLLPAPSTSSSSQSRVTSHYIYVRPHTAKSGSTSSVTASPESTVFVANIPVDASERDLRVLFGRWGVVEFVEFTGGSGANALEQAVQGLGEDDEVEQEEEEGEEESDDEAQDPINDLRDTEEDNVTSRPEPTFIGNGPKLPRRLRTRRKPALPVSVPEVEALPPLDPRSTPYGRSGSRCAHIVYLDALPLQRLMAHTGPIHLPSYGLLPQSAYSKPAKSSLKSMASPQSDPSNPTGLSYYISQYTSLRPPLGAIKAFADSSMARFDHLQSLLLKSRAKQQGAGALVDEDGFTVVVRGGRYGRTGGRGPGSTGVAVASKGFGKNLASEQDDGKRKGSGARPKEDFYRFQKTERKRQELAGLRAKFEQDKAKVDELKKTKRFTPY